MLTALIQKCLEGCIAEVRSVDSSVEEFPVRLQIRKRYVGDVVDDRIDAIRRPDDERRIVERVVEDIDAARPVYNVRCLFYKNY